MHLHDLFTFIRAPEQTNFVSHLCNMNFILNLRHKGKAFSQENLLCISGLWLSVLIHN